MKKFLLSGLICMSVVFVARAVSDTFSTGMFAGIIYAALDMYFVERKVS